MSNEKTTLGQVLETSLSNDDDPAAPYGLTFVDDVVVAPLEDKAWQQVVEMLQTPKNERPGVISFGGFASSSEPLQRDENDDLILRNFYNPDLAGYPVPETPDPVSELAQSLPKVEQQVGRIIREHKPDSDEFSR